MSNTKQDNFDDEEIIIDDDLDILSNPNTNQTVSKDKNSNSDNINVDEVLLDIELPLDEDSKRKLQKKDILNVSEQYDTELSLHEENIPITSEVFKDEEFVESIEIKYPKDVIKENKNRTMPLKKPTIVEEPSKTTCPIIDLENVDISSDNEKIEDTVDSEVADLNIIDNEEKFEAIECEIEEEKIEKPDENNKEEIKVEPSKPEDSSQENQPNKDENVPIDTKYDVTDLDEKIENKEFISRHDVIFSEAKGLDTYKPLKNIKKPVSAEEIVKRKNNLAMMFMIVFSTIVIIGSYFIFSNYKPPDAFNYEIPQEALETLTEEYFFITSIEEFLIEINENVEKERILIDNYVSNNAKKEETFKELNVVLKTKENLKVLYDKIIPIENEVIETKKLSDKIFQNTILTTSDIIDKINNDESKSQIVVSFNNHVDVNNSNIYMYNQYVQSVFRRYNISVTIDGDKFVLDTSWLKQK